MTELFNANIYIKHKGSEVSPKDDLFYVKNHLWITSPYGLDASDLIWEQYAGLFGCRNCTLYRNRLGFQGRLQAYIVYDADGEPLSTIGIECLLRFKKIPNVMTARCCISYEKGKFVNTKLPKVVTPDGGKPRSKLYYEN